MKTSNGPRVLSACPRAGPTGTPSGRWVSSQPRSEGKKEITRKELQAATETGW
jgi:hypothetical protein